MRGCPYKYVGYGNLPTVTVQRFWTNNVETNVGVITPSSRGRCSLSLTPSCLFSLYFFLSVVSSNRRVQQDSLLHCGRQWTSRTRGLEHTSASFRKKLRFKMSESNDPQRFEALESNVTEVQEQMSELMSMMRQLTQTRTAGVGQREEKSGGTGRGAAHNYSGGTGSVPPTADISHGATAAAEVPVHSRAASEPGRPADDTSRRPVFPAGVGPMIDVQRGEARECSRPLSLANGEAISIVGYGDLTVNLRTDHGWVRVEMNDVAHTPLLNYNLVSLLAMTLQSHTYTGDKYGITLKLNGEGTVFFPLVGKRYRHYGYRPEVAGSMVDTACVTIAPGKAKAPTIPTDINILHCTFGHTHEVLLKKTATQRGIAYSGDLHECRGCSMAKGLRKPIARSTHTRATKKLQRVFVDLSGSMTVQSTGGKRYTLIVRDDYTRFTRV